MKMKGLTTVASVFIIFYFEVISARSLLQSKSNVDKWLAMELEDVNRQCKLNVDYLIDYETYNEYVSRFIEYMRPNKNLDMEKSDYTLKFSYNPNLIEALKSLIERIQNCLDDENRLDSNDLAKVLEKILNLHARKVMLVDPVGVKDAVRCNLLFMNKQKKYKCIYASGDIMESRKVKTIFQLLVGYRSGPNTCEELLPIEQCFMKVLRACTPAAKELWKIVVSPPEIGICENFREESDPILTNDIDRIFTVQIQK